MLEQLTGHRRVAADGLKCWHGIYRSGGDVVADHCEGQVGAGLEQRSVSARSVQFDASALGPHHGSHCPGETLLLLETKYWIRCASWPRSPSHALIDRCLLAEAAGPLPPP